jgi:hypothetical protein
MTEMSKKYNIEKESNSQITDLELKRQKNRQKEKEKHQKNVGGPISGTHRDRKYMYTK